MKLCLVAERTIKYMCVCVCVIPDAFHSKPHICASIFKVGLLGIAAKNEYWLIPKCLRMLFKDLHMLLTMKLSLIFTCKFLEHKKGISHYQD